MTRTFSDGHPKVLPACSFLSQYYFYNIFLQKSCRFSLQTRSSRRRKPEVALDFCVWPLCARRPGQDFPPFFVQRLIHAHAQVCIEFGRAKWTTTSLNSFTIIILNNHFDPFIRCMLLREKCFHSLFIRPFTKPEREEVHSQRCKLFSNHSLRLKISY